MSTGAYKPSDTSRSTAQKLQVWELRLKLITEAIEKRNPKEASELVATLRKEIVPEAYPEFADNLDWLYRSIEAHLEADKLDEAKAIIAALRRLLNLARERIQNPTTVPPFRTDGKASS
jgi:hypothetical protein